MLWANVGSLNLNLNPTKWVPIGGWNRSHSSNAVQHLYIIIFRGDHTRRGGTTCGDYAWSGNRLWLLYMVWGGTGYVAKHLWYDSPTLLGIAGPHSFGLAADKSCSAWPGCKLHVLKSHEAVFQGSLGALQGYQAWTLVNSNATYELDRLVSEGFWSLLNLQNEYRPCCTRAEEWQEEH